MRRSQNQIDPQRSKSPELYSIYDYCVLCKKHCDRKYSALVCHQPCSEQVKKLNTKLNLLKSKLTEWKKLTQDQIKSPLIRLFEEEDEN